MTTLLALHGFTGSPTSFRRALSGLPVGVRCLAPALVGHRGSQAGPEIQSFDAEVARLAQLASGLEPLHLIGYSLGGRLALGLAVRYPERIASLTLLSTQPGLETALDRAARLELDQKWCTLLERDGIDTFVEAWEREPLWRSQERIAAELRAELRDERRSHLAAGLIQSLQATGLSTMPDLWPDLPQLQQPVRLLVGEQDPKFVGIGERMAHLLRHAELTRVSGVGHNLLLERPDAVQKALEFKR